MGSQHRLSQRIVKGGRLREPPQASTQAHRRALGLQAEPNRQI